MSHLLGSQTVAVGGGLWKWEVEGTFGMHFELEQESITTGIKKTSQTLFICHNFGLINELSCCYFIFHLSEFRESMNRFQVLRAHSNIICKITEYIYLHIYTHTHRILRGS